MFVCVLMPRSSCWVYQSECWKGPRQKACTAMAWLIVHVLLEGTINSWVRLLSIPAYSSILNCGIHYHLKPQPWTYNHQLASNSKFQDAEMLHMRGNLWCYHLSTPRSKQRTRLRVHVPDNFFHWNFKFQRSCFEGKLLVFNVVKHSETKKHISLELLTSWSEDPPRSRPLLWSLFPASPRKAHKQKDEVEP